MHPRIFAHFCQHVPSTTGRVLELGAVPTPDTLLALPQLANAERIGLNLRPASSFAGASIMQGNANEMPFEDNSFDMVLCNAMLEHDKAFWKTLSEIRRVCRAGGIVIIGVPGYKKFTLIDRIQNYAETRLWRFRKFHLVDMLTSSTLTFRVHNDPGDYYRFSVQALEEVFMDGMVDVRVQSIMNPPRHIAIGRKLPT